MNFSLVVTCFNEMKSLPQWYEDVMAQTRPPDEIIFVDSESTDGTTQFLQDWEKRDPRLKVIVQKCSPARGHNIGNELAQSEYIVSTDMGVRLDRRWFDEIVKPAEEDPTVDVVAGSYAVDKSTIITPAARAEYYIEGDGIPRLEPGFVIGNRSVVYKKAVWRELGGLPEDLTRYADDSVFGRQILQAGYKMAFAPNAMVYWARPQRLRDFWREQYLYGIGHGEADIKVPAAFRWYLKGVLPVFLVPSLTALRFFQKQVRPTALFRAIAHLDIMALICMPLLALGNGYHLARGHIVGYRQGAKQCQECRRRLKRPIPF